jgi:hypothetical protein
LIIHRDVNAAINICIWGYQQWLIKYGKTGQGRAGTAQWACGCDLGYTC